MQPPEMLGQRLTYFMASRPAELRIRCTHAAAAGNAGRPKLPTFWGAGPSFLPISGERRWKKDPRRVALPGGVPCSCAAAALGVLSAACASAHVCQRLMKHPEKGLKSSTDVSSGRLRGSSYSHLTGALLVRPHPLLCVTNDLVACKMETPSYAHLGRRRMAGVLPGRLADEGAALPEDVAGGGFQLVQGLGVGRSREVVRRVVQGAGGVRAGCVAGRSRGCRPVRLALRPPLRRTQALLMV